MVQFIYDGTFGGLLTAVFEVYERRCGEVQIVCCSRMQGLSFDGQVPVSTDLNKAKRVWQGLGSKVSDEMRRCIYWSSLSELPGIENSILQVMQYVFASAKRVEDNYGHPAVLAVRQTAQKVGRERHRFEAFVRFEQIAPDLFFASIDPDFNVLPILSDHFQKRYPAQSWFIYDTRRRYGLHYDKACGTVAEALLEFVKADAQDLAPGLIFDTQEDRYQALWKAYFNSTTIASRHNMKLHLRHVPKRYWKYLVEKK